jgi:hypothetical protein
LVRSVVRLFRNQIGGRCSETRCFFWRARRLAGTLLEEGWSWAWAVLIVNELLRRRLHNTEEEREALAD